MSARTMNKYLGPCVLTVVLGLAGGPLQAGAAGQGPPLPPISTEEIQERARYWMRKLRYAANPDDTERIRNNLASLGDQAIPAIVAAADEGSLKDQLPIVHWNTCLVLGKLISDQSIPYLLKCLKPVSPAMLKAQPEWSYVRANAALSLGKVKDPGNQALEPLRKIFLDPEESSFIRRAAALALGVRKDLPSIAGFEKVLCDPQEKGPFRGTVALALGMIPDDRSRASLLKYLKLDPPHHDSLADRMVVQGFGLQRKEGTGQELHELLDSVDDDLAGTTALVLSWLNDRSAAAGVEKVMRDEGRAAFSRANAAVALMNLGKQKEGSEYLRDLLLQQHDRAAIGTLAYAAVALGQCQTDDDLKCLHHVIGTTPFPVVAMNAINALGYRKDPRMVPFLIERFRLSKGKQNDFIRAEIVRALLSHPPLEASRRLLLEALRDASPFVRQKAAIALARFPGGDTEAGLIEVLNDREYEVVGEAALSLGILKSRNAMPALVKLLKDENDWVRYRARKAMENVILFGRDEFKQVAGIHDLIERRLKRVGGSIKDEMDRLYTVGYQQVLELDKPYKAGAEVR